MSPRCTETSLAVGEPMAGTAPVACAWIILEHPGPWGARFLRGDALPPEVAEHLRAATESGVTVLLARRPDTKAQRAGLRAWIARSTPGGLLLREGELDGYDDVLAWDLAGIGRGELPPFGAVTAEPMHFVCTNGARDQCCAIDGRALVSDLLSVDLPAELRNRVWECSHIGGHRFAPVMLTLPSGAVHGRLSVEDAIEVLQRAESGDVVIDRYRGRSGRPAPMQAVAIAARRLLDLPGVDDIDILRVVEDRAVPVTSRTPISGDRVECEVRHRDGRAWRAVAQRTEQPCERPESCDRGPAPVFSWVVSELTPTPAWT